MKKMKHNQMVKFENGNPVLYNPFDFREKYQKNVHNLLYITEQINAVEKALIKNGFNSPLLAALKLDKP